MRRSETSRPNCTTARAWESALRKRLVRLRSRVAHQTPRRANTCRVWSPHSAALRAGPPADRRCARPPDGPRETHRDPSLSSTALLRSWRSCRFARSSPVRGRREPGPIRCFARVFVRAHPRFARSVLRRDDGHPPRAALRERAAVPALPFHPLPSSGAGVKLSSQNRSAKGTHSLRPLRFPRQGFASPK
jgi:hypothetical protein